LKHYLAGAVFDLFYSNNVDSGGKASSRSKSSITKQIFTEVIILRISEVLLFAPSAIISLDASNNSQVVLKRLSDGFLKIQVRIRLTRICC
jgi:hypothetical protein